MLNIELLESNYPTYNGNYNAFQCRLPLDIDILLPVDDPVTSFVEIMKGIDTRKYFFQGYQRGNKGYDPNMMLQVLLFAFMNGNPSLRDLEELCKFDIRYMWLSNEERPSHMAFQRFITNRLASGIEDIFYDITRHIIDLDNVDMSILYIDGTKIEANARKTSFVWKKAVLKYRDNLYPKISEIITTLNKFGFENYITAAKYKSRDIGVIADDLMDYMVKEDIEIVYGKGKRKTKIQAAYDKVLEYFIKLFDYENKLNICGERNSYSKTDHDATMMNMKYDYYNQTGVFKPGYNFQLGVSDEYIVHLGVFPNPGDTKTFIPFMESYQETYGFFPEWPVGDAGYGSYDNYFFCLENGMNLGMKYNYYAKKTEAKFKKRKYHSANWEENDKGYKVCPEGNSFDQHQFDSYGTKGRYLQINANYRCEGCGECPNKTACTKSTDGRTLNRNFILEEFQEKVDENLATEFGKELKKQRSIQVEGAFGVIKEDIKYSRLRRRGIKNVKLELYLVALGFNLMKYHNKKKRSNEPTA